MTNTFTLQLNIVTCGRCGRAFGHEIGARKLTCPYCKVSGDISDFADMWYENGQNSVFTLER